jgi:leucyl-tRNA synthetase
MGPFTDSIAWNTENMIGVRRFLERVWRVSLKLKAKSSEKKEIKICKLQVLSSKLSYTKLSKKFLKISWK